MSNVEPATAATPKLEPGREGSISSTGSASDPDPDSFVPGLAPAAGATATATTQKRKGGRKPIYATSEERKQRNRQAQAAFRERRTEYIKQLEATIKHRDDTLQNLQQSHRAAADECLMLRYKNSLLERIILEKGIDVQAELNAKTAASPMVPPTGANKPQPVERTALNRPQHPRGSDSGTAGVTGEPGAPRTRNSADYSTLCGQSPRPQPTPPSRKSSPTSPTSGMVTQGGITSATADVTAQPPEPQRLQPFHGLQQQRPQPVLTTEFPRARVIDSSGHHPGSQTVVTSAAATTAAAAAATMLGMAGRSMGQESARSTALPPAYYSPSFQSHYNQLEREYDAQADMADKIEEEEDDDPVAVSAGPGPHPPFFPHAMPLPASQPMQGLTFLQERPLHAAAVEAAAATFVASTGHLYGASSAMLTDEDPFGTWHNLNFAATPYSLPPGTMR